MTGTFVLSHDVVRNITRNTQIWMKNKSCVPAPLSRLLFGLLPRLHTVPIDGSRLSLVLDNISSMIPFPFCQSESRFGHITGLFLVPHSPDQIQPLDLVTFGLITRNFSGPRFNHLADPQSTRLVRIIGA
jgi:hypothetical protein